MTAPRKSLAPQKVSSRFGCGAFAFLLLVLAACLLWFARLKGPTPEQVERRVRSEVPLGSTRAEVESWLRDKRIQYIAVEGPSEDRSGKQSVVDLAGLSACQISATLRAIVEQNARIDLLWSGEVEVYFFFDGQGLLLGYAFDLWIDSP
jgi:hypothetical protein